MASLDSTIPLQAAAAETPELPNMNIRMWSREVDPTGWGVDAPPQLVSALHDELREFLVSNGFHVRRYVEPPASANQALPENEVTGEKGQGKFKLVRPTVDAYFHGTVPFRLEPLVIDDGGRTVNGRPVLSIAVRDAFGESAVLYTIVSQMLAASGLHPDRARWNDPETLRNTRPGDMPTEVFRIRRLPGPGYGGQLAKALGGFINSLIPKAQPQT